MALPYVTMSQAEKIAEEKVGDIKLKTINNQSIKGEGNIEISASSTHNFPDSWPINGTCQAFLEAIGADADATVGKTYQGGIAFSDLGTDLGLSNAEAEVEIISSTLSTGFKIIWLNIYSATNEPYHWSRVYWWKGSAGSSTLKPWLISSRLANQYTVPVASGNVDRETGQVTFTSGNLSAGVYIISLYGQMSTTKVGYTYYFAYGGYQDYVTYSCDCNGTHVSALSNRLTVTTSSGALISGWDANPTIELYKMR